MIDAHWIGERFATDPAFHIPRKPRFPLEFIVLPTEDGLCIEGAPERQLLRGRAAETFLPELIALLDGTRSIEDITVAFADRPAEHVRDAVTLLYSRGLLEDGPLESPPDDDVAAFLGRFVDHTRHHQSRSGALAFLASASASIAAPPHIASMLRADLLSAGVGTVSLLTGTTPVAHDLTIVVETATFSAAPLLSSTNRGWTLYTTLGQAGATIGPLCVRGYSPCYACYTRYYRAFPGEAAGAADTFWAGVIGTNAFNLLSRIAFPQLYNRIQRIVRGGDETRVVRDVTPRVPSCSTCGCGADLLPDDPAFFAWALHTMTAMPPRALLNRRSYQDHFKPANIKLARKLPLPRPGAAVVALPRNAGARGVLDIANLALLLGQAAGYETGSDAQPHRLTPTGGNLASPELCVLIRGVAGIADGLYRYIGVNHELERIRAFDPVVARAIAGSAGGDACAIIVGTGLLDRVFSKYHVFAYRVVNVDAGFCLTSFMLGATALGVGVVEHPDFDPKHVAELLRLPARTKLRYPTFVLSLFEPSPPGAIEIGAEAFERVLHGDVDVRRTSAVPSPLLDELIDGWPLLLRDRRSIRDFSPAPVARPIVERILATASAVAHRQRSIRGRSLTLLPFVAVAHDGPGLPAGLYRFGRILERIADLPSGAMADLFQQENMASAAVGIFITANLEAVFAGRGPSGYREALVAAGVFAAGVVHAASASGIAACPSGGFFEHGLRAIDDSDGFRDCPLFAVALGHAAFASNP